MDLDRRIELISLLIYRLSGAVYQGPFKGLRILPYWGWGDGDTGGKLLGLYECELYPYIERVIDTNPDLILNIGCAEGFYGLGLAKRTRVPTILFDISESALKISRINAAANGLRNVRFDNNCSIDNYKEYLTAATNPFIFMDCEGAEIEVLDLEKLPNLTKATIIVECHDCYREDITPTLLSRFENTHDIELIKQGSKNPYIDIISDLSDWDKMLLTCESRPQTMWWLYMVPKTIKM